MVPKEGDELGIEAVRDRMEIDEAVMKALLDMQGVPKIYLRNSIPISAVKEYVDDYEITPAYRYEWDAQAKKVNVFEEPWVVNDDEGNPSCSLLPAPIVISLISQISKILGL